MITFLIGVIIGAVPGLVVIVWPSLRRWWSQRREQVETYGHPFDPVGVVRTRLPSPPPIGFLWELSVVYRNGDPHLTLGMLNLTTNTVTQSMAVSLTHNSRLGETWAQTYRLWENVGYSTPAADAREAIVYPLVRWAESKTVATDGTVERHEVIG